MWYPKSRSGLLINIALFAGLQLLMACTAKENKQGDNRNLDIRTPVGDIHVSNEADAKDIGLTVYPGARLKPASEDSKSGANVNISTSIFGVKVAALEYLSDDSPEKVAGFYRRELAKYGAVLECRGRGHITMPKGGNEELSCETKSGEAIELKVGTRSHQHLVSIKPDGPGSQFALVYINTRGEIGGI
jgi:hypothetical protein